MKKHSFGQILGMELEVRTSEAEGWTRWSAMKAGSYIQIYEFSSVGAARDLGHSKVWFIDYEFRSPGMRPDSQQVRVGHNLHIKVEADTFAEARSLLVENLAHETRHLVQLRELGNHHGPEKPATPVGDLRGDVVSGVPETCFGMQLYAAGRSWSGTREIPDGVIRFGLLHLSTRRWRGFLYIKSQHSRWERSESRTHFETQLIRYGETCEEVIESIHACVVGIADVYSGIGDSESP